MAGPAGPQTSQLHPGKGKYLSRERELLKRWALADEGYCVRKKARKKYEGVIQTRAVLLITCEILDNLDMCLNKPQSWFF